jgi:hypothetical protein
LILQKSALINLNKFNKITETDSLTVAGGISGSENSEYIISSCISSNQGIALFQDKKILALS